MSRFILPKWVQQHNQEYHKLENVPEERIASIRQKLSRFNIEDPEVSIVIPAYNEEKDLLKALSSLAELRTKYKTELIVANNNSKDKTQEIIDRCGIKSVFAENQGISYARQAGLEAAKGKYILNADSDSIYPETWGDLFIEALKNPAVSCVYGTYSFIPSPENTRLQLGLYELIAESFFAIKRKNRECVNVMGFNFAFRKEDGLKVGGYNHHLNRKVTKRSEDGWMAYCLMEVGKLQFIPSNETRVWTSDRRLMEDGSLSKAFTNRAKKELKRISIYFNPKKAVKPGNTDEVAA
ncbi:MAG TPA: glycosyltransferase family 2 protein [Cytophagaceae bacterium]